MSERRMSDDRVLAEVERLVATHHQAVQEGETAGLPSLVQRMVTICGPDRILPVLVSLLGRYFGEKRLIESALDQKKQLLDSLLAAPRRVAKVLGLIRESLDDGCLETWAVVEGSPHQAVRFALGVDPEEVCAGLPDEPAWVWLVESMGSLAVAGAIEPPPLLQAGMEREMVFEGFVQAGDGDHVE